MATPSPLDPVAVTGLGVTSAIGQGVGEFAGALKAGRSRMAVLGRELRQPPGGGAPIIGAELDVIRLPGRLSPAKARNLSLSAQAAIATLDEAWGQAGLADVDPDRIGLVIGGSNLQQRELCRRQRPDAMINPTYAFSHFDTDLVGVCTETFGVKGPAFTIGAASASGQMAAIQAAMLVAGGEVDACVALGGLSDLSHWECEALQALGAMSAATGAPQAACRPFDRAAGGFVFGEACAAIVIEGREAAEVRDASVLAWLTGWAMASDANRQPNPSREGEVRVIQTALARAGLEPRQIDYVNPHGSGSPLGDRVEVEALRLCGLAGARTNATKSITGHGLASAGLVELVAAIVQLNGGWLHPSLNLTDPIDDGINWVIAAEQVGGLRRAINLSHGFGGLNTAVCLEGARRGR